MKFTVSQSSLMKALSVVAKGMGTNSTLPILSGIYIRAFEGTLEFQTNNLTISIRHMIPANVEEEGETVVSGKVITIRLVATDSFRLAVCDSSTEAPAGEAFRAIVSGNVFHDVLTMPSMTETIRIGVAESQVVFTFGTTTFVSRKIEGNFPDYKQLLPASCGTAVEIDAAALAAALKRVSVIAVTNASVRFDIDADGRFVRLSASSPEQGESSEIIDANIDGQSLSIALNYHYVFDCMNAVAGSKTLRLELQSSAQPGIFKSNGLINYLYLLMPVRL